MFSHLPPATTPAQSAADLAALALNDESSLRLPHFSSSDAVTLGLSLRKRFRSTHRHARGGSGALIGIYDAMGHTLFECTVGDLGDRRGVCDVGLESWTRVKGMVEVVRRTSHSSFYVEKGLQAMGKTANDISLSGNLHITGGAFPLWLENALSCPIAIVVLHSGSSADDHRIVCTAVRDTVRKMNSPPSPEGIKTEESGPVHQIPAPSDRHSVRLDGSSVMSASPSRSEFGTLNGNGNGTAPSHLHSRSGRNGGTELSKRDEYASRRSEYDRESMLEPYQHTRDSRASQSYHDGYEDEQYGSEGGHSTEIWPKSTVGPVYRPGFDQ